jgi:hypothetical protein
MGKLRFDRVPVGAWAALGNMVGRAYVDSEAGDAYTQGRKQTETTTGDEALSYFRENYQPQEAYTNEATGEVMPAGPATPDEYIQQNPEAFAGLSDRKRSYEMGGKTQATPFSDDQRNLSGSRAQADFMLGRGDTERGNALMRSVRAEESAITEAAHKAAMNPLLVRKAEADVGEKEREGKSAEAWQSYVKIKPFAMNKLQNGDVLGGAQDMANMFNAKKDGSESVVNPELDANGRAVITITDPAGTREFKGNAKELAEAMGNVESYMDSPKAFGAWMRDQASADASKASAEASRSHAGYYDAAKDSQRAQQNATGRWAPKPVKPGKSEYSGVSKQNFSYITPDGKKADDLAGKAAFSRIMSTREREGMSAAEANADAMSVLSEARRRNTTYDQSGAVTSFNYEGYAKLLARLGGGGEPKSQPKAPLPANVPPAAPVATARASAPAPAPAGLANVGGSKQEVEAMMRDAERGGHVGKAYIQKLISDGETFSYGQRSRLKAAGFDL